MAAFILEVSVAAAVKGELDEQTARGKKIKTVSCWNSPGKKVREELELWHWKRSTALWLTGARRKRTNRAGCKSQSSINLSTRV